MADNSLLTARQLEEGECRVGDVSADMNTEPMSAGDTIDEIPESHCTECELFETWHDVEIVPVDANSAPV